MTDVKLHVDWTKGLDNQGQIDVRQNFKESVVLRRRMSHILEKRIKDRFAERMSKSGYDNPNWAYLQADASGYERAMTEILQLIK